MIRKRNQCVKLISEICKYDPLCTALLNERSTPLFEPQYKKNEKTNTSLILTNITSHRQSYHAYTKQHACSTNLKKWNFVYHELIQLSFQFSFSCWAEQKCVFGCWKKNLIKWILMRSFVITLIISSSDVTWFHQISVIWERITEVCRNFSVKLTYSRAFTISIKTFLPMDIEVLSKFAGYTSKKQMNCARDWSPIETVCGSANKNTSSEISKRLINFNL